MRRRLRWSKLWIIAALVVGANWLVPTFADAGIRESAVSDFNRDGYSDLAIGTPNETISGEEAAGAVNVLYGAAPGLTADSDDLWAQGRAHIGDVAEQGDRFGSALATGDFDRDGYVDLAIGAPNEDVAGRSDAGAVSVIYGSSTGLSGLVKPDQFWSQDSVDIQDQAESSDLFGAALAAADFNEDGYADLAIGVPGERTFQLVGAFGAVNVIYGSPGGLDASFVGDQVWSQDSGNVSDSGQAGDMFGYALAAGDFDHDGVSHADLAIGVPGEDVGDESDAGAVNVLYGAAVGLSATASHADQFWTQDSQEVFGSSEEGDHFGMALTVGQLGGSSPKDLAIGVPGEDLGTVADAGGVSVIYGTGDFGLHATQTADQFWSQDRTDVEDSGEPGDRFGAALVAADFGGGGAQQDLAIGVPGENVGSVLDAGAVAVIYGSPPGLRATATPDQLWHQNVANVFGSTEPGDAFGSALAAAHFGGGSQADLAVGTPGESVGAVAMGGGVSVIFGSAGGLSATVNTDQFWSQDSYRINDSCQVGDSTASALAPG